MNKSNEEKKLDAHYYICVLGEVIGDSSKKFCKGGIGEKSRMFDHSNQENNTKLTADFQDIKDVKFYNNPYMIYCSLNTINNAKMLEEEMKAKYNESDHCQTYDCKIGTDIREYFLCNNINKFLEEAHTIINTYDD